MERFNKIAAKRFKFFEDNQDKLFEKIKEAQNALYISLLEYFTQLDTDNTGNLKRTAKNVKTLKDVDLVIQDFNKKQRKGIARWIVDKVLELLGLNRNYFDEMLSVDDSVESKARRQTMASLGFDATKNRIIEGGYLYALTNGGDLSGKVALEVNRALALSMPLKDFIKEFKNVFTNPADGLGILERHYYTIAFDLFQRYDRQIGLTYADELKLTYAIYAGTTIANTRQFCGERNNRIYTKEFIQKWVNLSFTGKPKSGYNPLTDCGGYNCRHHLNWISNELADELLKTTKVNAYSNYTQSKKKSKKKSIFK